MLEEDDFSSLSQINLCEVLDKNELDINEIDLFLGILKYVGCGFHLKIHRFLMYYENWVFIRWARKECTRYKIQDTPKHIRLVLKEALNLIRFPTMTKEDFAEKVVPTGVLSEREVTEVNRYFDATPENRFANPKSACNKSWTLTKN